MKKNEQYVGGPKEKTRSRRKPDGEGGGERKGGLGIGPARKPDRGGRGKEKRPLLDTLINWEDHKKVLKILPKQLRKTRKRKGKTYMRDIQL